MKIRGSNRSDTLFGTARNDTISAGAGNDLITTGGGIDTINGGSGGDMMTGFAFKLKNSDGGGGDGGTDPGIGIGRAAAGKLPVVDGGEGYDVMLMEMTAARGGSELASFRDFVKVRNVEEFIYNFASVTDGQNIYGSNSGRSLETVVVGGGNAYVDTRGGDDFIFTGDGNDTIKGGNGSDLISAGNGHNIVSGGGGADYFQFRLTGAPQYTEITDFQGGVDKVLISIDASQYNLIFDTEAKAAAPVRSYGDKYLGVGAELNSYVSYNNGRYFEPASFSDGRPEFADWAIYDSSTGSIFIKYYTILEDESLDIAEVLVAQVQPGTAISSADFDFRLI